MAKIVNKARPAPARSAEVEAAALHQLRELLRSVPSVEGVRFSSARADAAFDFEAELTFERRKKVRLAVEFTLHPRLEVFGQKSRQTRAAGKGVVMVLAAPRVNERMATLCAAREWSWFDLAGNCRIAIPGFLHLERSGRSPVVAPTAPLANLASPEAGRVVRALLAAENLGRRWTQRDVAACIGAGFGKPPSLGLVNKVVRRLLDEGVVRELPERGFRLSDPEGLLLAWNEEYRFDIHRRSGYFTLLKGRSLAAAIDTLSMKVGRRAAYAAFSAADRQAPHVRQPHTWLYVGAEHEDELRRTLDAKPVESGENLIVLFPADDGVFLYEERHGDEAPCTGDAQTYVDLRHAGGRGEEAATALLEQRLRPAWIAPESSLKT